MPIRDLYGEAAGLLRGTADTVLKGQEIKEARAGRSADMAKTGMTIAGNLVERKMAEKGATERQKMQNDAQLIDLNDALVNGAAKVTGDEAWLQLKGQKMRSDVYSTLLTTSLKQSIGNYDIEEVIEGDSKRSYLINKKTGDRIPLGSPGQGKKPTPRGGGATMSAEDKEFLKTYRQYAKDTENFNYEMAKGLSTHDPKQAQDLERKLKFVETGRGRFEKLQGVEGGGTPSAAPVPDTSQTPTNENAQALQYLREKYPGHKKAWTQEDIAWAKGKIKNAK